MDIFFDGVIIFFGCYIFYIYYLMKVKQDVREGMLLPKGYSFQRCKDKEGYIREMGPKLLVYGAEVLLCGVAGFVEDTYGNLGIVYLVVMVLFVVLTIWFAIQARNAVKKYWGAP